MHNPYQSPANATQEAAQPSPARPISVWLLLLFLGVLTIMLAIGAAQFLWFVSGLSNIAYLRVAGAIAWRLAILALVAAALYGIVHRRQWGRWLGVLILGTLAIGMYFLPDTMQTPGAPGKSDGFYQRVSMLAAVTACWIYACGFSNKARRYFAP